MRLDLKENIVFPFSDPSWIAKTLTGLACQLLVFTAPALVGYQLAVIRQSANGEDEKLPEFDGFASLWMQGLLVTIILALLFSIPIGAVVAASVGGFLAMGQQQVDLGGMILAVAAVLLFLVFASFCLIFLLPALMLRYAMTGEVSSLFDISTALGDIKQGFGDYLMIVLFPILVGLATSTLALCTMGVGLILAIPVQILMMYIQGRMIGNYYRLYFM